MRRLSFFKLESYLFNNPKQIIKIRITENIIFSINNTNNIIILLNNIFIKKINQRI
jgi:hypothetical protein